MVKDRYGRTVLRETPGHVRGETRLLDRYGRKVGTRRLEPGGEELLDRYGRKVGIRSGEIQRSLAD